MLPRMFWNETRQYPWFFFALKKFRDTFNYKRYGIISKERIDEHLRSIRNDKSLRHQFDLWIKDGLKSTLRRRLLDFDYSRGERMAIVKGGHGASKSTSFIFFWHKPDEKPFLRYSSMWSVGRTTGKVIEKRITSKNGILDAIVEERITVPVVLGDNPRQKVTCEYIIYLKG